MLQERRDELNRKREHEVLTERSRIEEELQEKALNAVTAGASYVWIAHTTEIQFEENRKYLKRKLHMTVKPFREDQNEFVDSTYEVTGTFRF